MSNVTRGHLTCGSRRSASVLSQELINSVFASEDESHLLLRSHLTMEDLESTEFKVHDPCVSWLSGKDLRTTFPWNPSFCPVSVDSDQRPVPVVSFSESEVALRTREGHVLSFSLSSNLTTTLLDNSSLVSSSNREQISVSIGSQPQTVGQIAPPDRAGLLPD